MDVDPNAYSWGGGGEVMLSYTITLRRKMSRMTKLKVNVVEKQWDGLFPHNFKLKWNNMWSKPRSKKEARFIWAIWNKTIVVNVWRVRVNISIDDHFRP